MSETRNELADLWEGTDPDRNETAARDDGAAGTVISWGDDEEGAHNLEGTPADDRDGRGRRESHSDEPSWDAYDYDGYDEPETQSSDRRDRAGYASQGDKGDRRGRITSLLALLLAAASVAAIFSPNLVRHEGPIDRLVLSMAALGLSLAMMVPAVLLGLRSASKPKGHVGRGRGLVSVMVSAVAPCVAFALMVSACLGLARSVMGSGLVAKSVDGDSDAVTLVTPAGKFPLSDWERKVFEAFDLMPEAEVSTDSDDIAVEASDGSLYIGGSEQKASEGEMTDLIARAVEKAQEGGYSVSIRSDGTVRGVDEDGNEVVVSLNENMTGVNIQTTTDMTFQELLESGGALLGRN